jgi:ACS family tartrate transporter-like MFS transporter
MVLWGRSSDAKGERVWHVAIPALVAAFSFGIASVTQIDLVMLVAVATTQVMLWSAIAPLIALPSTFLAGSARAGGIALVVSIGQLGGFLGSTVIGVLKERTGDYAASMAVIGFILCSRPASCWRSAAWRPNQRLRPRADRKARNIALRNLDRIPPKGRARQAAGLILSLAQNSGPPW